MRSALRIASGIGAATFAAIAVTPAMAATPISQAGANAITVSLGGEKQGSGNVTAKNDGSGETKTGETTPPISVLQGQSLFKGGALAQEASAGAAGRSAACAGLAGSGGSVVNIGGSSCLAPGDEVNGTLSSLDLSGLVIADPDSDLAPFNALGAALGPVTDAIDQALAQVGDEYDNLGLVAGFGAVEGRCTASLDSADGDATLTDAGIALNVPGETITLLDFPVNPPPNTHLTTDLSAVLDAVLDAVRQQLTDGLQGHAAPIQAVIDAAREEILNAVVPQVEANLGPLEENILDVILNKQSRTPGAIKVNAIDMRVLPAAEEQMGAPAAEVQIGNVACGPNGRVAVAAPAAAPEGALPRGVSAGLETAPNAHSPSDGSSSGIALGAFAIMLASGTALVVVRRLRA